MKWYIEYVCPLISRAPEILRYRVLEVDDATVMEGTSYATMEKEGIHTYITYAEIDSEEWPWDAVFELAQNEKWKEFFESQEVVVSRNRGVVAASLIFPEMATKLIYGKESV